MSCNLKALMGRYLSLGIAWSRDEDIRREATSGGLVTSILIATKRGGLIDGAIVTANEGVKHRCLIARSEEEIINAIGSKYCQIPVNMCLKELLNAEGRYAVVGLPCHLRGLEKLMRSYPRLRDRVVLKIGLFCSHTISYKGILFLLKALGVSPEEVEILRYRAKMRGTTGLYIRTRGGKDVFIPLHDYWGRFFDFFFTTKGCMYCTDFAAELSDISVGDAWGVREAVNKGLSLFVIRSRAGKEAIELAVRNNLIELREISRNTMCSLLKFQRHAVMKKGRSLTAKIYRTLHLIGMIAQTSTVFNYLLYFLMTCILVDNTVSKGGT
jgi:coenzyme F420 hydrogenase subunit beta